MKKIGLICLALVMALGALGVGYATWSQTLIITQTVETGTLRVGVRDVGTNDNEVLPDPDGVPNADPTGANHDPGWDANIPGPTLYGKDVAHTESVNGLYKFTKVIDDVPTDFYHSCSDTIYSGYPCYAPLIVWEITNDGTIPVKLELSFDITEGDPAKPLDPFVNIEDWKAFDKNGLLLDSGSYYLYEFFAFLEGFQLEPCDSLRVELTKHIWQEFEIDGVMKECPQGATVTYTMTVNAVQWNMYTP